MSSRTRAKQRKQEREQRRKRNRQLTIIGAIVAVVVVLVGLFAVSNLPAEAPIPAEVLERYENFITGETEEGFPILGNPDADVSVVEYSSFSCPGCENFHRTVFPSLLPRIVAGEINFTYVPLQFGSLQNPNGAAKTALCAGEQGMFWEMHDVLFDWHATFANSAFLSNRLLAGAEAMGLDMGQFNSCFNATETNEILDQAQASANASNVVSTPTLQVNGTTVDPTLGSLNAAIDQFGPFDDVEPGIVTDADSAPEDAEPADDTQDVEEPADDAAETDTSDDAADDSESTDTEAATDEAAADAESDEADAGDADASEDEETNESEETDAGAEPEATEESSD